jgi:hypothetical protein
VKWEHKLDTELDGSILLNDIYRITNDTKLKICSVQFFIFFYEIFVYIF